MNNFLKNNKIKLTVIAFLIIIIAGVFIMLNKLSQETTVDPAPSPTSAPTNLKPESVNPGTTSREDLLNIMGEPKETSDGKLFYDSNAKYLDNEVIVEDGAVQLFKEIITTENQERTVEEIQDEYGYPEIILYNENSVAGHYLYSYPTKGIAYNAHNRTQKISEIWYFVPTSLENFLNTWAEGYSQSLEAVESHF